MNIGSRVARVIDLSAASTQQVICGFRISLERYRTEDQKPSPVIERVIAASGTRRLRVCIEPASMQLAPISRTQRLEGDYLLGDGQDAGQAKQEFLGHGALLRIEERQVFLRTSLTGFPPIFVYQDGLQTVIASSIARIAAIPGVRLAFDAQGIAELARIGKPINYRTLFKNLSIVPAGTGLQLNLTEGLRVVETWRPSEEAPFASWKDYIAAQEEALAAALHRMDLSRSFFSLTAGLDTRAIFALLYRGGVALPAFTKSSSSGCLDAKRAKELCDAYKIVHETILLDQNFTAQFPECVIEASFLSGGLASFNEASEIFFYKILSSTYDARLSGNLGNQIGRSGTEGASMRDVPTNILAPEFLNIAENLPKHHWFETVTNGEKFNTLQLIQQESLFASIANFSIGQSYVRQQTPYADRTVILQKLREPIISANSTNSTNSTAVRMRDLKHRFLGDPRHTSFQRQLIIHTGGEVARNPINWGWRASGGVSLSGILYGMLALLDVVISTRLPKNSLAARTVSRLGMSGFSSFEYEDLLSRRPIAEFVYDTLKSDAATSNAVLNQAMLRRALDVGFNDRAARKKLLFALDVVLAQRNFKINDG